jgi:uncharacterized membrane protein YeaQ/YmgE (transglycosylase-associated protein family)
MLSVVWMLAGATIGWAAYAVLHYNESRGMLISMAIGVMGGVATQSPGVHHGGADMRPGERGGSAFPRRQGARALRGCDGT